jgi:hypothetical protein
MLAIAAFIVGLVALIALVAWAPWDDDNSGGGPVDQPGTEEQDGPDVDVEGDIDVNPGDAPEEAPANP